MFLFLYLQRTKLPKPKIGTAELYKTLSQTMWARPAAPAAVVNPSLAGGQAAVVGSALGKFQEFVDETDLGVGRIVDVFGRKMYIAACDSFTRDYYRDTYGLRFLTIDEEEERKQKQAIERKQLRQELPPHNGFGSEEDSRQNVGSLNPKPPKRDLQFELNNSNLKLSFLARLINKVRFAVSIKDCRPFIVSYVALNVDCAGSS